MTEEQHRNEVVLREMFAAFERGDYAGADTYLTPDNQVIGSTTSHFQPATAVTMTDRAHMLDETYPEWKVTLRDIVPAPGGSSLVGILATSLRRTGDAGGYGALTGAVYSFRDGLICRVRAFQTADAALREAGLEPHEVTLQTERPQ